MFLSYLFIPLLYVNNIEDTTCVTAFFPLSCSLHTEKLYNSTGRELRRALFSLKQIFQVIISLFYLLPDL